MTKPEELSEIGTTDIEKFDGRTGALIHVPEPQPVNILELAISKNMTPEQIEKFWEIQQNIDAVTAEKAYNLDMAEAQKNPPKILKTEHVEFQTSKGKTSYNHANLADVSSAICAWLAPYGFVVKWKHLNQTKDWITMRCTIKHKLGHSEDTELGAPPDNTGGKNTIQAIASTTSYLERYTVLALTGQAPHEIDNDGRGNGNIEPPQCITKSQVSELTDLINAQKAPESEWLEWAKVDDLESLPAKKYKTLKSYLEAAAK